MHPTAWVDPGARLGSGVIVGPFAVIEADVIIGHDCRIGAHAVLKQYTQLGADNQVFEHAVLGGLPQDSHFGGDASYLTVGDRNIVREGVTMHRSTRPGGATRVGSDGFFMAYSHVAHDCRVADRVVLANGVLLGGHVEVGERVFLGGGAAVHQFCRIGRLAMIGGLTKVSQDCLPFCTSDGHPARLRGLNTVGLRRAGVDASSLNALKHALRIVNRRQPLDRVLPTLRGAGGLSAELARFIETSERGVARGAR